MLLCVFEVRAIPQRNVTVSRRCSATSSVFHASATTSSKQRIFPFISKTFRVSHTTITKAQVRMGELLDDPILLLL